MSIIRKKQNNCAYIGFLLFVFLIHSLQAQTSRIVDPLNDGWKFKKGSNNYAGDISFLDAKWMDISIPHTYNNVDMQKDKNFYTGDAFYKKEFFVPDSLKDRRIYLRFEGVGSVATVYVNGRYLIQHKGEYSAFAFEITHVVRFGQKNTILVKTNNEPRKDVIPVNNYLFPLYGGIYRPVSMIITNKVNISVTDYASSGIYITQRNISSKSAEVIVKTKLENKERNNQNIILQTTVKDAQGRQVLLSKKQVNISRQGITTAEQQFTINNPHLWNGVKDPYLYSLTTSVIEDGKEIDAVTQPLGLRQIEVKAGEGVFLNGKKHNMFGVTCHQDRWGYGSALSKSQEKEDMDLIREIGATTIRLAHYQQSEHIYALADSIGFLIWAEIPFVNTYTGEEAENAKQQMTELVRQNFNHPSIYIWGIHNEVYCRTSDDYVAVLTRQINDIAKTNDSDRLTGSVSGYGEMDKPANLNGDIQGINRYYGWYEGKIDDLNQWADKLKKEYLGYRVMLTEYGADGNIDKSTEKLPDPKNIDPVNGQFSPEAYQTETHIHQWAIIEKHPYILASYLWNMFEFATPMWNRGGVNARNIKGLITFDRKRKKDSFYWYKANWNSEPMIYLANRRDSIRTKSETKVQLFSNLNNVTLLVNGKIIVGHNGVNKKHWIFENVGLTKGINIIQAFGKNGDQTLKDKMKWILK